jgi:hypothetical protein
VAISAAKSALAGQRVLSITGPHVSSGHYRRRGLDWQQDPRPEQSPPITPAEPCVMLGPPVLGLKLGTIAPRNRHHSISAVVFALLGRCQMTSRSPLEPPGVKLVQPRLAARVNRPCAQECAHDDRSHDRSPPTSGHGRHRISVQFPGRVRVRSPLPFKKPRSRHARLLQLGGFLGILFTGASRCRSTYLVIFHA